MDVDERMESIEKLAARLLELGATISDIRQILEREVLEEAVTKAEAMLDRRDVKPEAVRDAQVLMDLSINEVWGVGQDITRTRRAELRRAEAEWEVLVLLVKADIAAMRAQGE